MSKEEPLVGSSRADYVTELVASARSENKIVVGVFDDKPILVAPTDSPAWADYRRRAIEHATESVDTEGLSLLLDDKTFQREIGTIELVDPCISDKYGSKVEKANFLKGYYSGNRGEERVWNDEFVRALCSVPNGRNQADELAQALPRMESFGTILEGSPLNLLLNEVAEALVRGKKGHFSAPDVLFSNGTVSDGPPKLAFNQLQKWLDGALNSRDTSCNSYDCGSVILAVYIDPRSQTDRLAASQYNSSPFDTEKSPLWNIVIRDRFLNEQDMNEIQKGIVREGCSISWDIPQTVMDCSAADDRYWSSTIDRQIAEGCVPKELATLEDVAMQAIRFAVEGGPMGTTLIKLPKTSVVITGRDSPRMACEKVITALGADSTADYIREQFPHFPRNGEE